MKNLAYLLALHTVEGLGSVRLQRLINYFADPKLAWEADYKDLLQLGIPKDTIEKLKVSRIKLDPLTYIQDLTNSEIKIVTLYDSSYPHLLKEIADPPLIIYYKGEFSQKDENSIGVVGTRKITNYGKLVTEKLVSELVYNGLTIVSGLARGVDTVAHQTSVKEKGRTIAVLGGGLNSIFPPENTALAEKIIDSFGVVLSEFPPCYPHLAGNFPARNRIISGLSLGVLVTEATEDSGSLITARCALEQGREVFAVPGQITSQLTNGPSLLIKDGAKLVIGIEDILEELPVNKINVSIAKSQENMQLSSLEKEILNSLENESKHIDEVCRQLKCSINEISGSLIKLEILGVVKNLGGGNYIKN